MMKNQVFWKIMMAGSLAGWCFALYGLFFPIGSHALRIVWWCVLLGWSIGHPLELAQSLPIGAARGLSPRETVAKTLAFGVTWWLPLKLGVIRQ